MIQAIYNKYCKNNLVQLMPRTANTHLILSADEIILFTQDDEVLINKYTNHPSRNLFPFSDKEQSDYKHFTEIFEYNKTYLNYRGSGGFSFQKDYFFKGSERALHLTSPLPADERNATRNETILSRSEIENIFNADNYDSMFLLNGDGDINYARSKKEKLSIGKNIIPSDEEIIKRELRDRKFDYQMAYAFHADSDTLEKHKKAIRTKTIDEIKNLQLYGGFLRIYNHMLLTTKDGKFNLMWFKIDFIEKDKFKLTTSPIQIIEPTIDDVINYCNNNDIEFTPEPQIQEKSPVKTIGTKPNKGQQNK